MAADNDLLLLCEFVVLVEERVESDLWGSVGMARSSDEWASEALRA